MLAVALQDLLGRFEKGLPARSIPKRYSIGSFWTLWSVAYSFVGLLITSAPSPEGELILTNASHFPGRASPGKIASTRHSRSHAPPLAVSTPPASVNECFSGTTAQNVSCSSCSGRSTLITRQ